MIKLVIYGLLILWQLFVVFNGDPIGEIEVLAGVIIGFSMAGIISIGLDLHERQ